MLSQSAALLKLIHSNKPAMVVLTSHFLVIFWHKAKKINYMFLTQAPAHTFNFPHQKS